MRILPRSRPVRIALGLVGALVLALVLVAPVVLRGGSPGSGSCARSLLYDGHIYKARPLDGAAVVQELAVGVGVASGCGAAAANVDVRSLAGIPPGTAVALPTETANVYVRQSRCVGSRGDALVRCLRG